MLRTISQVRKEVWSGLVFIIVIHLLLLILYAFVYYNLSHFSKPPYPPIKANILGVYT